MQRLAFFRFSLILLLLFIFNFSTYTLLCANTKIDSLINVLKHTDKDTNRINILLQISKDAAVLSIDSSIHYVKQAENIVNKIKPELKSNFFHRIADNYASIGMYYSSINNYLKSIETLSDTTNKNFKTFIKLRNSLAYYYSITDNYDKSIAILYENIEKTKFHPNQQPEIFTILAYTFRRMGKHKNSLLFYRKALEKIDTTRDPNLKHIVLNEIGNAFSALNMKDSALYYYHQSLFIRKKINNIQFLLYSYNDLGSFYCVNPNNDSAMYYLKKCLQTAKLLNSNWENAHLYLNLVALHLKNGTVDSAKYYTDLAQQINNSFKSKDLQLAIYSSYKEIYKQIADYEKSLEFAEKFSDLKDSLTSQITTRQINEFESYYQGRMKEQEIRLLKKKEQKQLIIRNLLVLIVGVLIALGFILFRSYKFRVKANTLLVNQNKEIKLHQNELIKKNDEIATQRDALLVQTEEIEKQRLLLFKQKQHIMDSLRYANRIQHALMPDIKTLQSSFPKSFLIYRPQQIVGGDFYWIHRAGDKIVLAVADCTGHGVPGGFMSMLGITLLDGIVNKKDILQPNKILEELKTEINSALKHYHHSETIKDGMDISICCFDFKLEEMHFAASNHSIYMVFNNSDLQTELLNEVKGDHNSISIDSKFNNEFSSICFSIKDIKTIYFASDGFSDQFGGENNRKLNKKNFKSILAEASKLPIHEQYNFLDGTFLQWKQNYSQTDDVLLLGIEL